MTRYGTRALQVARHQSDWSDADRLPDSHDYSLAEIDYIVHHECVEHLADVVMRRTTLAVTGSLTRRDLHAIAPRSREGAGLEQRAQPMAELEATVTQLEARNLMRL